jgi:hypothetical protein
VQNSASPASSSPPPSALLINSYHAKLIGFDLPLNLKYLFLQKKNTIYLSTGFSSNFFISESYTYGYNYKNNTNKGAEQEATSRFKSLDLARVINISVGLEHPLKNKTRLSVEPFLKYPLSGLGSHDIRYSAAGLNLKFGLNR